MRAVASDLPQFVRDMLASPPKRGEGLHNWLYRVARVLHPCRPPAEIVQLLAAVTAGEPIQRREIEDAVKNSRGYSVETRTTRSGNTHACMAAGERGAT